MTTAEAWSTAVFSTTPGVKSVANYYKDNSINKLSIVPVTHSQSAGNPAGVVSVSVDMLHPYYGTAEATWVTAAINAASVYVNFYDLDANANGYIDRSEAIIYLIPAGYEDSGGSSIPNVWAHATTYSGGGLPAAGKSFPVYALSGELTDSGSQHPIGVIVHELGHQICGLPDLYDTSQNNAGLGNFSVMAGGSWGKNIGENAGTTPTALDVWSREYIGWLNPVIPFISGPLSFDYSLTSDLSAYKLINPASSTSEYFLIENRYPTSWDLGLMGMSSFSTWQGGLLITHIDTSSGTVGSNDINSYTVNNVGSGGHQGVVPLQASVASCDMLAVGSSNSCRGRPNSLFYSGNNATWSSLSAPNSNFYNGTATNFSLTGISAPASTMTANLSLVAPVLRTISVTKLGAGTGVVSSTTGGISCGSTCSGIFYDGTTITLSAVANPFSEFGGWSGGGCSGTGICQFTVSADTTVNADFGISANVINQNFDTVSSPVLPLSWESSSVTTNWETSTVSVHPAASPHSGTNLVFLDCYNMLPGVSASLVSPVFSLSGITNSKVKFWMYRDSGGYTAPSTNDDRVSVYINSSNSLSGATLLGTVNRRTTLTPIVSTPGWYEYTFDLPGFGNSNYVVFNGISGWGNNILLDDISVFGVANPIVSPTSASVPATFITATTATLNGTVSDGGALTATTFQYGLTSGYGSTAPGGAVSAGAGNSPVNAVVSGLTCNTTYHFRVTATNSAGTSNGNDLTFTTNACPPAATTIHAENITETAATLEGLVTDGGALATVTFEYGLTSGYGSSLSGGTVSAGSGGTSVNATINGLICGTQYHFRVSATNSAGSAHGDDASFTTNTCPLLRVGGISYQTLQSGYNADVGGAEIKLLAGAEVGLLAVNQANQKGTILVKGGYDSSFTTDGGQATILGAVTLSAGTTQFQNVKIR
jgi:M6 family metalloprotease-like protein